MDAGFHPADALIPLLVAGSVAIMAGASYICGEPDRERREWSRKDWRNLAYLMAAFAAFIALMIAAGCEYERQKTAERRRWERPTMEELRAETVRERTYIELTDDPRVVRVHGTWEVGAN